jgi:hypothetical protein
MRTTKRLLVGCAVAVSAFVFGIAGAARGDVSTERPGSILIFPKVVNTAGQVSEQDTIIQISNTRPDTVHARCFYINGAPDPNTLQPQWQVTDFSIWLTRQQPTSWRASQGRLVDATDNAPPNAPFNAGLDPGLVPPIPAGFTGELLCAEVDASDVPIAMNSLKGEATVKDINSLDVSKYNALAIQGIDPADGNNTLLLDNDEYNGCPSALHYSLISDGAQDPVISNFGNGGLCSVAGTPCQVGGTDCPALETCDALPGATSEVRNFLTLIPCSHDLENLAPATVDLNVTVYNEFEQGVSRDLEVACWRRFSVTDPLIFGASSPFSFASTGSVFAHATIEPVSPTGQAGILGVADSVSIDTASNSATAAANLHMGGNTLTTNLPTRTDIGDNTAPAVIRLTSP